MTIWYRVTKNSVKIKEVEVVRETEQCLYVKRTRIVMYSKNTPQEERVLKHSDYYSHFATINEAVRVMQARAAQQLSYALSALKRVEADCEAVSDLAKIVIEKVEP